MSTWSVISFSVAAVFYVLACRYVVQLMRDVNEKRPGNKVSIWTWRRGWKPHREFFPHSPVRSRIVAYIALSVGFGLVAFCNEVRHSLYR